MTTFDKLVNDLTQFWTEHGQTVIVGVGLVLAVLVLVLVAVFLKSGRKSAWAEAVAISAVLGWTSEGMWKVAVDVLHFPVQLALVTFFVAEAMLLAAALRAKEQRALTGLPGTYGQIAWVLALAFGTVVALNAESFVEVCLRILLPLAVIWLWWAGLMMPSENDTDEMKNARRKQAEEREATWAITPRSVLVRWGVLKPGKSTTTEAQREFQIQRMVQIADKAAAADNGARRARLLHRLRRLTRTADEKMVAEVAARVARAVRAEQLMLPALVPAHEEQEHEQEPGMAEEQSVEQATAPLEHDRASEEQPDRSTAHPAEQTPAPEEQMPAPWAEFVREHEPQLPLAGGVEQSPVPVSAIAAPRRSTFGADSAGTPGLVRAVATVPTGPSGRSMFMVAVTEQLRNGDLRILSAASRTRNAAGYDAAAALDGELTAGTVRKYVAHFRELIGLGIDVQGEEAHRAAALARFPAPAE